LTAGVSAKTGVEASAGAGLDGNNAYASVNYSDTTEAHATVEGQVQSHGVGVAASGDAYAVSGTTAEASVQAGDKGVAASGALSSGTAVGVDGSGTVKAGGVSATAGSGVSVGNQVAIGGGGQATYDKGVATVGVSGDVALALGVKADVSVSVDTHQVQQDAQKVAAVAPQVAQQTVDTGKTVGHAIEDTGKKAGNAIVDGGKKAVNKLKNPKKWF
jgi:hypothetical protein